MKVVIAADIHGSLKYMKRLELLIDRENIDKLFLLGDLYYHGPRNELPEEYNCMEVAKILNKYKDIIVAVRGNCDAEVDQMISEFDIRDDYKKVFLDDKEFILTHGHLFSKYPDMDDKMILCGHTHVYNLDGKKINPGSVGLPKVNKEHTCIVYDNSKLYLYDLDSFKILKERDLDE